MLTTPSTKDRFEARILLDSVAPHGGRLTTMEITYPRFVHAELMTHRQFSRNSASSRAIPVEKMLEKVKNSPAMPIRWQANQSGMQGGQDLTNDSLYLAKKFWIEARDKAVEQVEWYLVHCKTHGLSAVHKQIINRILEPWLWHTVVVSSTEWSNFFALRLDKDAQPEIRHIAVLMQAAYNVSEPQLLQAQEWHTPLILPEEYDELDQEQRIRVSVARCARVSYLTHDGKRDIGKDLELYDRLATHEPMHASPLEHVGAPHETNEYSPMTGNFRGWIQWRKTFPNECR